MVTLKMNYIGQLILKCQLHIGFPANEVHPTGSFLSNFFCLLLSSMKFYKNTVQIFTVKLLLTIAFMEKLVRETNGSRAVKKTLKLPRFLQGLGLQQ